MSGPGTIELVKDYAARAHGNQRRKYTPGPYIVYPVRVMETCRKYTDDQAVLAAALLHDVLEDTEVTEQELHEFLVTVMSDRDARRTMDLVIDLTDVYIKKDYPGFNRRARKEMERNRIVTTGSDAQTIKYADIIDNCREISSHDPDFARVFLHECRSLLKKIPSGHPGLYREAVELVEDRLEKLRTRSA